MAKRELMQALDGIGVEMSVLYPEVPMGFSRGVVKALSNCILVSEAVAVAVRKYAMEDRRLRSRIEETSNIIVSVPNEMAGDFLEHELKWPRERTREFLGAAVKRVIQALYDYAGHEHKLTAPDGQTYEPDTSKPPIHRDEPELPDFIRKLVDAARAAGAKVEFLKSPNPDEGAVAIHGDNLDPEDPSLPEEAREALRKAIKIYPPESDDEDDGPKTIH